MADTEDTETRAAEVVAAAEPGTRAVVMEQRGTTAVEEAEPAPVCNGTFE
jgi:hypothetical protein